jgi:hypothetical protein
VTPSSLFDVELICVKNGLSFVTLVASNVRRTNVLAHSLTATKEVRERFVYLAFHSERPVRAYDSEILP